MKIRNIRRKNLLIGLASTLTISSIVSIAIATNSNTAIASVITNAKTTKNCLNAITDTADNDINAKLFNVKNGTIYGFNATTTSKQIQEYINEKGCLKLPKAKRIAPFAFASLKKKYGVTNALPIPIPADVEEIGDYAFYDNDITELTFEKGSQCHTIGKSAFAFCKQLAKIEIPSLVCTNNAKHGIKERAFYCCDSLTTIDFTKTTFDVAGIKSQFNWHETAFKRIPNTGKLLFNITKAAKTTHQAGVAWTRLLLAGLPIVDGTTNWKQCNAAGKEIAKPWHPIPNEFFKMDENDATKLVGYNDGWLTGKWENWFTYSLIPAETTSINFAADRDNFFTRIGVKEKLTTHTMEYCTELKALPESLFYDLDQTNNVVTMPPKLEEIGPTAFANTNFRIYGLTKQLAPGGTIKKIGNGAFKTCLSPDLKSLTLKADLEVEDFAFMQMTNLKNLNLVAYGKKPGYWRGSKCFETTVKVKRTVTIIQDENKNTLDQWRICQNWMPWFKEQAMNIADDEWTVKPVGSTLKYNDLFKVENGECKGWITDHEGKLPTEAEFDTLLGETTVMTFPETITKIGESAFAVQNEEGEYESTIPDNITTIDFSSSKITEIGKNAFVNLPETVTTLIFGGDLLVNIGESAFENGYFSKIQNLDKTVSLQKIGDRAFYNCDYVSEFSSDEELIPTTGVFLDQLTNLTTIGNDAFARWDSMTGDRALKLTPSLTSIGRNAFYANRFNTVEIPKFTNEITIGNNAFAQDTLETEEQINCISMVAYADLTTDPLWVMQEGSYIFAGVAQVGKILIGSSAPQSQEKSMKKFFAQQSKEIEFYDWQCERQE